MRFYPALTLEAVQELEGEESEMLMQAISRLEAEEALVQIKISAFPHMKSQDQEKIHRAFYKQANPEVFEEKPRLTTEDLYKRLMSGRR